jgi:hypothetical protein
MTIKDPPYSQAEWMILAESSDADDRCEALDNIPDEVSDEVVRAMVIERLSDSDPLVRVCAADEAGVLQGMPEVVDALRQMIRNETDDLAIESAYVALGCIGDVEDIPLFVRGIETLTRQRAKLVLMRGFCFLLRRMLMFEIYKSFLVCNSYLDTVAVNTFKHLLEDEAGLEHWAGEEAQVLLERNVAPEATDSIKEFITLLKTDNNEKPCKSS